MKKLKLNKQSKKANLKFAFPDLSFEQRARSLKEVSIQKLILTSSQREHGITLISLIVSIIILILLAIVSIRSITGEESLIKVSSDATEDYNILQYKEQIEQLRESIILKYEMEGRDITLEKLAQEMDKESTWIKSAIANVQKEEANKKTNDDIIVTTFEGYTFQLYYSESYGQKFIEYLGRENGNILPNVIAEHNKSTLNLDVRATEENSGIEKIEVIYKGDIVKSENGENLSYKPEKTGWYIIRVTSNMGKYRYAWVRISSLILSLDMKIKEHGEQENGWYGKDNIPVIVEITAKGENTAKIIYTFDRWKTQKEIERKDCANRRNKYRRCKCNLCICSRF